VGRRHFWKNSYFGWLRELQRLEFWEHALQAKGVPLNCHMWVSRDVMTNFTVKFVKYNSLSTVAYLFYIKTRVDRVLQSDSFKIPKIFPAISSRQVFRFSVMFLFVSLMQVKHVNARTPAIDSPSRLPAVQDGSRVG
jgi:hypothetical protein